MQLDPALDDELGLQRGRDLPLPGGLVLAPAEDHSVPAEVVGRLQHQLAAVPAQVLDQVDFVAIGAGRAALAHQPRPGDVFADRRSLPGIEAEGVLRVGEQGEDRLVVEQLAAKRVDQADGLRAQRGEEDPERRPSLPTPFAPGAQQRRQLVLAQAQRAQRVLATEAGVGRHPLEEVEDRVVVARPARRVRVDLDEVQAGAGERGVEPHQRPLAGDPRLQRQQVTDPVVQAAEVEAVELRVGVERGAHLAQRAHHQPGDLRLAGQPLLVDQVWPQNAAQRPPVQLQAPLGELPPPALDRRVELRLLGEQLVPARDRFGGPRRAHAPVVSQPVVEPPTRSHSTCVSPGSERGSAVSAMTSSTASGTSTRSSGGHCRQSP